MTKLSIIVAHDLDNIIGSSKSNSIPWHLPPDLKYFRELTMYKPIIMGKNTFLSLKEPLEGRMNIVITRNPKEVFPFVNGELAFGYSRVPVITCTSLDRAIHLGGCLSREVMIVGGGQLYKEALAKHDISVIYKTVVMTNSGGDIEFPQLPADVWVEYLSSPVQEHKGLKFYVSQMKKVTKVQHR